MYRQLRIEAEIFTYKNNELNLTATREWSLLSLHVVLRSAKRYEVSKLDWDVVRSVSKRNVAIKEPAGHWKNRGRLQDVRT